MNKGLGFIFREDPKNKMFPASVVLPNEMPDIRKKEWFSDGWWGDQGVTNHCVAYSCAHYLNDGPRLGTIFKSRRPMVDILKLYCEAQKFDPWEGDCENYKYEGTSIQSAMKVLKDWEYIQEYRWLTSIGEIIKCLLVGGPIVVGTYWYEGMSFPDENNFVRPGGRITGGHAYLLNGIDRDGKWIRFKNSWGQDWGDKGHAYMSIEDVKNLIAFRGQAAIATK